MYLCLLCSSSSMPSDHVHNKFHLHDSRKLFVFPVIRIYYLSFVALQASHRSTSSGELIAAPKERERGNGKEGGASSSGRHGSSTSYHSSTLPLSKHRRNKSGSEEKSRKVGSFINQSLLKGHERTGVAHENNLLLSLSLYVIEDTQR